MKKIIFAFLLMAGVASISHAQLKFRGIPLNRPMDSVIADLSKLGYRLDGDRGTAVLMRGTFSGKENCQLSIIATPSSHMVWKIVVLLPECGSWSSLKDEYYTFKDSLKKKYTLDKSYEFFSKPYYEGDGYELQAVRMKKCNYLAIFNAEGGDVYTMIKNGPDGPNLWICYEDTQASALDESEKAKTIEDDL